MYGVLNAALQHYVCRAHGISLWEEVARASGVPHLRFEPMLDYDPSLTSEVLKELGHHLALSQEDVLEDIGVFLVTHPSTQWLHRLLRFSADNYADFLRVLPDIPNRIAIAAFDIGLPSMTLTSHEGTGFTLTLAPHSLSDVWRSILIGLLRAMADSYDTLCAVDPLGDLSLDIHIFDTLQISSDHIETRWGDRW